MTRQLTSMAGVLLAALALAVPAPARQQAARAPQGEFDPAAAQALSEARSAFSAGHYKDALKAYRRASKIEREACFPCWSGIVQCQKMLGDFDGALKSGDKLLALAASDQEKIAAHVIRGDTFMALNANDKTLTAAESEYREGLQSAPNMTLLHSRLAVAMFKQSKDDEGRAEARRVIELEPSGSLAAEARQLLANPERARRRFAPEFHLTTLQGEKIGLDTLAGKVVVLDFWATWCGPCRQSVGELRELVKRFPQDEFVLISVSADKDERKWRDFVSEKKMEWRQYWDSEGDIGRLFDVHALPTYLVIDRDGSIRERLVGLNPQDSVVHRLKERLPALFAAKQAK